MDVIKVKTSTGFEWDVDPGISDDMELIDQMALLFKGEDTAIYGLIEKIIGQEGKTELYEHCRGENGRVSAKKVMAEINEIFVTATEELKKLQASQ